MHSRHAGTSIEGPFWSSSLVPQLVQKPRKTSYNVRQCCIWLQQISLDSHLAWSMLAANMAGRAASSHASSISGPASRRQLKTLASTGKLRLPESTCTAEQLPSVPVGLRAGLGSYVGPNNLTIVLSPALTAEPVFARETSRRHKTTNRPAP